VSQADELSTSATAGADVEQVAPVEADRTRTDRRTFTWKTIVYGIIRPRRSRARRTEDHESFIVDIYKPWFMWVAVSLLMLSAIDAFLVLSMTQGGEVEQNLLLAKMINLSPHLFVFIKLLGTGLGVVLLTLLANYRVFGFLRGRSLLYAFVIAYAFFDLVKLFRFLELTA
jgi:hypothetical protein